jgi:cytochrome b6-f complex iron-sulfur subunit
MQQRHEGTDSTADADRALGRRPVLAAGGAAAAAALLAACGGGDAPAASDTSSSSSAPASSSSSSSAAAGGSALVELSAVPVGGAVSAKSADGKPIIVAQPTAGQAVAFSAKCTHMGCTVAPSGAQLKCPCHGSQFSALTGKVEKGPAKAPLASFPVKVEGGSVVAG